MADLKLEQVSKYYKHEKKMVAAVHEIDLTIQQGEFVFVTGSSGAGKSTLLQLMAGEIAPTHGSVSLEQSAGGKRIRFTKSRRKQLIGYVPQVSQLMRQRTIAENLYPIARMGRFSRTQPIDERVKKALSMVGLPDVGHHYPVELSQGECRRVELARAILNSPPILILDELTANLDEDVIWDLFHLLCEFQKHGTTIVMATHAKIFVNMMRKRVITLVDGKIFGDVAKGRYGDLF